MATDARRALLGFLLVVSCVACGGSSTPAAATSPSATAEDTTSAYVAMVRSYWDGIVAADGVSGGVNVASRACLGTVTNSAPPSVDLVEPAACRPRAMALLAVQQKFLGELGVMTAPGRFTADDRIFRNQVPLAVDAVRALISATATGSRQATFDASNVYVDIMLSSVIGALDDVDPTTKHY